MSDFEFLSKLFADYAWFTDLRDVDGIVSLYEKDGEMTIDISGGDTVGPFFGQSSIKDFIGTAMQGLTDQRRHVITNIRIVDAVEGDVAATAFLTLMITEDNELRAQATGLYTVTAIRVGDSLRIRKMHLLLDSQY